MISIVSPTMWLYQPYLNFLKYIVRLDVIKEIIIIDNAPDKKPNADILNHEKIKVITFGKNIFINPAWNEGSRISESDIICILNDDIHFDLRLFYKIDEFFKPGMGAIGLSAGIAAYGQTPLTNGIIDFELFNGQNCEGFGELMFIRKENWCDIPEGLLLGYGDNFIFDYHYFKGLQNYFITNIWHHHEGSFTQSRFPSAERQAIYEKETAIYNQVKAKLYDRTFYLTSDKN